MRLEWAPLAIEDREVIFDAIVDDNFPAALELDQRFQKGAALLQDQPKAGRMGRVTGTRELVVHRHYVLVYDLPPDSVRILRVLHTSRQWPPKAPPRPSKTRAKKRRE